MKHDKKINRSLSQLTRGIMIVALLINYLPVAGLPGNQVVQSDATPAAEAPVISKDIDHTSLYIKSGDGYQRGVREYVTALSPDGGVLTYAWFINDEDKYLDGTDDATTGTFGNNGKDADGDGNTDYQGSYGTQSASSNILVATSPTTVGKYYTYVEITNSIAGGEKKTVRSKRAELDVRANLYQNKVTQGTFPENNKVVPDHLIMTNPNPDKTARDRDFRTSVDYLDSTLWYVGELVTGGGAYASNNDVSKALHQMEGHPLLGGYDLFSIGNSSKVEDISTIPGKIYEFAFTHTTSDTASPTTTNKDFASFTVAKSKLTASDYSDSVINRYWDGRDNISASDDKDNGKQTFKFNTTYMNSGGSTNYGVFPYGMNGYAQGTNSTTKDVNFMMDIWNAEFGTDYFFDIARHILFPDTFNYTTKPANQSAYDWQKALYDSAGVPEGLTSGAIGPSKLTNANAPVNSNFLSRITALNKKNQFVATTYGGDSIQWFLSNDGSVQSGRTDGSINKKSGYVTIPETQGATVLAFTSLSSDSLVNDNFVKDVVFKPISKPVIKLNQSYDGTNTLTVTAKADYAYALIDVSYGYSQFLPNVSQYTDDATIDPDLGRGDNWFTTSNASVTFKNLAVGRSYRVIAIPKDAIQKETNSNMTPLDVLDTDAWVDTTIGIPKDQGQVLAGAYKSGAEMKGRVMLRQANLNNYYALLAIGSDGRPITGTPVKAWAAPDANGELEFDNLDLLPNDNHYVVITKPQAFFSFDYAQATYSPTEVYQPGNVIPPFAVNEPVMTATPVTITNKIDYQALSVSELSRTLGQAGDADNNASTDTLTITYDPAYRGGIGTFPAGTKAIAFDKKTGTVAAPVYTVDLNGKSTATLSVPSGKDWEVILKFGDDHDLPILALAAPEVLEIDYLNETLLTAGKSGPAAYNTQDNVDYRLKSGSDYYLGSSATQTVQGSNTQPINLTPALDDTPQLYADGTLTYTQHIADATRTIGTQRTLAVPKRPDALTMGTNIEQVKVDYPNETVNNAAGQAILLSANHFTTSLDVASSGNAVFTALNWTGNADVVVSSRTVAIAGSAFKGKISDTKIIERPAAPTLGTSEGVMTSATADEITFTNTYSGRELGVSGENVDGDALKGNLPATIAAGGAAHTATGHSDDNTYEIVFTATETAPKSKVLDFSTSVFAVETVDFGDVVYGTLGPDAATPYPNIGVGTSQPAGNEFPSTVRKKAFTLKNTGDRAYWLDAQYLDSTDADSTMKFDNQGLFAFTGGDNLPDNYGGGALKLGGMRQLLGQNIIEKKSTNNDLHVLVGNVNDTGNWTPALSSATGNTTGNINTAPVGLYKTRAYLAYSEYIEGETSDIQAQDVLDNKVAIPSDPAHTMLKNPSYFSAQVQLNIVQAQWDNPIIAAQTSKSVSGQDNQKLNYQVTENSIAFDIVLDDEVDSAHLMISTNGGMNWFAPGFSDATIGTAYDLETGQAVRHVSLTQTSAGAAIRAASTYDILVKVIDDTNHTESETVTQTFWTQAATPTDKDQFVNYFSETLSFTDAYEVKIDSQVRDNGDSVTADFTPSLTLTAMVKASGDYPASEVATFTYDRSVKPALTVTNETVYYTGTGAITSQTVDAIQVRNDGAAYDGSSDVSKSNLFSGVFYARRPATSSNFASEEVKVLLLPDTYNVRVKVGETSDASIGASDYDFESPGSLYLKKVTPQDYTQAFADATFSRTGYVSQLSQALPSGAQAFTAGGSSFVVDASDPDSIAAFDEALANFNNFKTNVDSTHALARQIIWGDLAGTYTVEIPAEMRWNWDEDNPATSLITSDQVTINAWDHDHGQPGISSDSLLSVKIASTNDTSLTNSLDPSNQLAYSVTLAGETSPLANGDIIKTLAGDTVDNQVVTQDFTATVTTPPSIAGAYKGHLTFEVSLRKKTP